MKGKKDVNFVSSQFSLRVYNHDLKIVTILYKITS